jgi:hypothetical protein
MQSLHGGLALISVVLRCGKDYLTGIGGTFVTGRTGGF